MFSQVELELFSKVLLAGLLGFVVGLERELMASPAGDRTFSLVAIGSALFMQRFAADRPSLRGQLAEVLAACG